MSSHHRRTPLLHVTSTPGVVGRSIPLPLPAHLVRPGTHRSASRDAPFLGLEPLEPRTLLAATIAINFQPSGAAVPPGYLIDSGAVFASRNNGYSYGWNALTTATRDRNSSRSPDQRYDTLNHMQKNGSRTWEIALPNGLYTVKLVAGDPNYTDSTYKINAESTLLINGTPTSTKRWITNTATISVTDGRLTLSNASGAKNNKINFVEITPTPAPGTAPLLSAPQNLTAQSALNTTLVDLTWTNLSADVLSFRVERSTNGTSFTPIATVNSPGSGPATFRDGHVNLATQYHYRVIAVSSTTESAPSAVAAVTTSGFQIFDATMFTGKPDLSTYGLKNILIGYEWAGSNSPRSLLTADKSAAIEANVKYLADEANRQGIPFVLDVEAWPLVSSDKELVKSNLARIIQMIEWAREGRPGLQIGIYGFPHPSYSQYKADAAIAALRRITDLWRGLDPDTRVYDASHDLIGNLDFLSPSLYVRMKDVPAWEQISDVVMAEARRVADSYPDAKPVYPFLWMQYEGTIDAVTGQSWIRDDAWAFILSRRRIDSDGVILWSGPDSWNNSASWWTTTQSFLNDPGSVPGAPSNVTVDTTGMRLSWVDNSANEGGFDIERSTDGSSFTVVGRTVRNETKWIDSSYIAGTKYWYRVRPIHGTASTLASNITSAVATRNAFDVNEAENWDSAKRKSNYATGVSVTHEDWLKYGAMDFGVGAGTMEFRIEVPSTSVQYLEVRLDSLDGPIIGSGPIAATGGWGFPTTQSATIAAVNGIHDLYLLFSGGQMWHTSGFTWFRFV